MQEQDVKKKVKKLDHHIKKLYRSLQDNTLCVVLIPELSISLVGDTNI